MLRPKQMSKVSVTGSKRAMEDVIETVHGLNLLHVSEYDGSWEGFTHGDPIEGAEETSEQLVTVRSIESILDVDRDDVDTATHVTDEAIEAELRDVREQVNELDDRREEIKAELRDVRERIDSMAPFATLGIELDLLQGYDSLAVRVGHGDADAIEAALANADAIEAFELFVEDDVVAVFARPADGAEPDVLGETLVGVEFAQLSVPDAEGSPEAYLNQLRKRAEELEAQLTELDDELEEIRMEAAEFLLAAEEHLTIDVQKREAPLSFATTRSAFIAEGWIPTERYEEFEATILDTAGEHATVEELERASFTPDGNHHSEAVEDGEVATDGGHVAGAEQPPVIQDNNRLASPFEMLVNAVNRPNYREFDPTLLVFLTFPLMFGFMIADIGYGVLYMLIGYYFWTQFDSDGLVNVGAVAMWAGGFTVLFGIMFGFDVFGHHLYGLLGFESWDASKGISPGATDWAQAWLVFSVLFGVLHLNIGYVLSFVSTITHHDVKHAMYESGSWLLLLNGLWVWVFSAHLREAKPDLLFDAFGTVLGVQFQGLPEIIGLVGLGAVVAGVVLLVVGEPAELPEVLSPLVNAISYTRITAVLLAKGGMAVAANLLAFGAYIDGGSFHFIFTPSRLAEVQAAGHEIVFAGMTTQGSIGIVAGILVAIVGHIVVLLLGITAAGIQGIRLEYVEFFNKFYEGGGTPYSPFGRERVFSVEE